MKRKFKRFRRNLRKRIYKEISYKIILKSKKDILKTSLNVRPFLNDDKIFMPSDNWYNPILNARMSMAEIYISEGYINAALWMLTLIKLSNNNGRKNAYIYPAMFCFRQYIELIMKDTIRRFEQNEIGRSKNLGYHNLNELWIDLKQYIDYIDEEVNAIDKLILELQRIDGNSFSFRYLTERKAGRRIEFTFDEFVDVDELEIRMLQIYRFFEGLNSKSYEVENYC